MERRLLRERLGDAGRKIHTGRSRNDQVLVASRLWLKQQLSTLMHQCKAIAQVSLQRAEAERGKEKERKGEPDHGFAEK